MGMRFLADENFPGDAVAALREEGHDVVWTRTDASGLPDDDVLRLAEADERVLLTFDKDFGELASQHHLPVSCGIVLFRLPMYDPEAGVRQITQLFISRADWAGEFWVVDEQRIRVRPLPRAEDS